MELPPLQPLRIPAGWMMLYNDFREADPSPQSIAGQVLRDDLLQIKHPRSDILIDVGWYGDADSGRFSISVQEGDFRGRCLHEFHSRDRPRVVAEVERLLLAY